MYRTEYGTVQVAYTLSVPHVLVSVILRNAVNQFIENIVSQACLHSK